VASFVILSVVYVVNRNGSILGPARR